MYTSFFVKFIQHQNLKCVLETVDTINTTKKSQYLWKQLWNSNVKNVNLEYKNDISKIIIVTEPNAYLGKDARKSARNLTSRSVTDPNCRSDISYWDSGGDCMGLLFKKHKLIVEQLLCYATLYGIIIIYL